LRKFDHKGKISYQPNLETNQLEHLTRNPLENFYINHNVLSSHTFCSSPWHQLSSVRIDIASEWNLKTTGDYNPTTLSSKWFTTPRNQGILHLSLNRAISRTRLKSLASNSKSHPLFLFLSRIPPFIYLSVSLIIISHQPLSSFSPSFLSQLPLEFPSLISVSSLALLFNLICSGFNLMPPNSLIIFDGLNLILILNTEVHQNSTDLNLSLKFTSFAAGLDLILILYLEISSYGGPFLFPYSFCLLPWGLPFYL